MVVSVHLGSGLPVVSDFPEYRVRLFGNTFPNPSYFVGGWYFLVRAFVVTFEPILHLQLL